MILRHFGLIWTIVSIVAATIHWGYMISWIVGMFRPAAEEMRKWFFHPEMYFGFPVLLLQIWWDAVTDPGWFNSLAALVNTWLWWRWMHDHDHDDRWKKKRKQALEKVKQVGGKLVIVPVPAPMPA